MTAYSDLKLRARAQAHDITDPSATVTGKDVNERRVGRSVLNFSLEADAGAGTTIAARSVLGFPASQYPNGVEVKSITMRSAAITPHADNHGTDTFTSVGTDGVADSTVGSLTADADVAIGSGGLGAGATTANKPYSALLSTTAADCQIVAGGSLAVTRTKAGGGLQFGVLVYEVVVEAL